MKIRLKSPDGRTIVLTPPDGTSKEEIQAQVNKITGQLQQKPATPPPALDTGLRAMTGSMNPTPPNVLPEEGQVPYTTGQQAGEKVAETLAEAGHPIAGTAAYAIPRTAQIVAESAIGGLPELGATGAMKVPAAIKAGTKSIGSGFSKLKDILKAPSAEKVLASAAEAKKPILSSLSRAEKELADLELKFSQQMNEYKSLTSGNAPKEQLNSVKSRIAELKNKYASKAQELKKMQAEAGQGISQVESKLGLKMKEIPEVGDTKTLANQMNKLSEKSIEDIKSLGSETIQKQYKRGQLAKRGNITPEEEAFINKGMAKLDEARGELHPELKEALSKHREITNILKALPENMKAEKATLNTQAVKLQQAINKVEALAKEAKEQLGTAKLTSKSQIMSRKIAAQQKLAEIENQVATDLEKAKKKAGLIKAGLVGGVGLIGLSGAGQMVEALRRLGGR